MFLHFLKPGLRLLGHVSKFLAVTQCSCYRMSNECDRPHLTNAVVLDLLLT